MNILFVNYGDFTTNSLNHIGGFADTLCNQGHACVVAVTEKKATISAVRAAHFIPATYDEVLARPNLFPDSRPADLIHAWTPREGVRKFVLAYQRLLTSPARLVIHLEDNENYLISAYAGRPFSELRDKLTSELPFAPVDGLSHPLHSRTFLRLADGITTIVDRLREFVPTGTPSHLLSPGVDFRLYRPLPPDPDLRRELGIAEGDTVIVFTGSVTFANALEVRELYLAVQLLNERGVPAKLIRTGFTLPDFHAGFGFDVRSFVIDLGFVEKARLPALLALADVLVQPGHAGAFDDYRLPSKLPEFLASGKPVVLPAANIAAQLRDGRDVLILKTGSPAEIADACQRVVTDDGLGARLGKNGLDFARAHFDLAANTAGLVAFYTRIAALPSSARWADSDGSPAADFALAAARLEKRLASLVIETRPPGADLAVEFNDLALGCRQLLADLSLEHTHNQNHRRHIAAIEERLHHLALVDQSLKAEQTHNENHRLHIARLEQQLRHLAAVEESLKAEQTHNENHRRHIAGLELRISAIEQSLKAEQTHNENHRRHIAGLELQLVNYESALRRILELEHTEKLQRIKVEHLEKLHAQLEHDLERNDALRRQVSRLYEQALELLQQTKDDRPRLRQLEDTARQQDALLRHQDKVLRDFHELLRQRDAALRDRNAAIHERDIALRDRNEKIRRMQSSASWVLTAPLRFFRRHLVDRFSKPAAPVLPPVPAPAALPPTPDFASVAPSLLGLTPADTPTFEITAAAADEPDIRAIGTLINPAVHVSLDSPRNWSHARGHTVTVRGWLFFERPVLIAKIRARFGDRATEGTYGQERPDVAAHHPNHFQALHSGFTIKVPVEAGDEILHLEVADERGAWIPCLEHSLRADALTATRGTYAHWVALFDTFTPEALRALGEKAAALQPRPRISVLMPVYNPPEKWLVAAIESVRTQLYTEWELCISDDASTQPHVRAVLEQFAAQDPRIKTVFREKNGHISAATNSALTLATGDFIALFDHDDALAPHALYCIALEIAAHPQAELIYSDEDKIDETGFRFDPHFKPDWNPDLFTTQNYVSHLTVYRASTLRAVGGLREGFEGSQDWDLALRVIERVPAATIRHIPRVLYHWRALEGSTALHLGEKDYAGQAAQRALTEYFARQKTAAALDRIRGGHWHIRRALPANPPLVTLVIPTRNRRELLEVCVDSILAKTSYPNFEILVADNDSDDPQLLAYYEKTKQRARFEVLSCPGAFNYSAINNRAVRHARGEIVGLLNNDLEALDASWLDEMVGHALRPEIGCVGAKLLYPNRHLQHAGVITGLGGVAGHAFKNLTDTEPGTAQFRPHVVQNLTAVTAACLLVRKAVFLEAGGLDEAALRVAFNDVDFCLKVQALGYRNLYTPHAVFIHYESASRGAEDTPEKIRRFQGEIETMRTRWADRILDDPAYNPNFTLDSEDFALAYPPRTKAL